MKPNGCKVTFVAGLALLASQLTTPARAQFYKQTNLVSDLPGAAIADPNLVNPWGVALSSTSPFWVANAATGTSTLYSVDPVTGHVTKAALVVATPALPSGLIFNGSTDFQVSQGGATAPARFLFAGLNGTISGWNAGVPPPPTSTQAILAATGAPLPASYTGLAIGARAGGSFLYAANNAAGRIDVFDANFLQVSIPGSFVDPNLPAGNAPFNVVNVGGLLYVTYSGPTGVVNIFNTEGQFIKRFATGGTLLNPWGLAMAPAHFGQFSNALLIGNFNLGNPAVGPGSISAFDPATGGFLGRLRDVAGVPLSIDGLWSLVFGNGGSGGSPDELYFAAGIQGQSHGLFGSLTTCHGPLIGGVSADPAILWPPNHQMVGVTIDYSVADNCDAAPVCALSVSSSEGDGGGSGHTAPDWEVVDAHHVMLRSERMGNGNGRVYSVAIDCGDKLPLSSSDVVTVGAPHDRRAPAALRGPRRSR